MESRAKVITFIFYTIFWIAFCIYFIISENKSKEIVELKKEIYQRDSINEKNKLFLDSLQAEINTHLNEHHKNK